MSLFRSLAGPTGDLRVFNKATQAWADRALGGGGGAVGSKVAKTTNGTESTVTWQTEIYDDLNAFDLGTDDDAGSITEAGLYLITVGLRMTSAAYNLALLVGGTQVAGTRSPSNGGASFTSISWQGRIEEADLPAAITLSRFAGVFDTSSESTCLAITKLAA